jgi:hypothetical protein
MRRRPSSLFSNNRISAVSQAQNNMQGLLPTLLQAFQLNTDNATISQDPDFEYASSWPGEAACSCRAASLTFLLAPLCSCPGLARLLWVILLKFLGGAAQAKTGDCHGRLPNCGGGHYQVYQHRCRYGGSWVPSMLNEFGLTCSPQPSICNLRTSTRRSRSCWTTLPRPKPNTPIPWIVCCRRFLYRARLTAGVSLRRHPDVDARHGSVHVLPVPHRVSYARPGPHELHVRFEQLCFCHSFDHNAATPGP